jgi:hypothetical protein
MNMLWKPEVKLLSTAKRLSKAHGIHANDKNHSSCLETNLYRNHL